MIQETLGSMIRGINTRISELFKTAMESTLEEMIKEIVIDECHHNKHI